MVPHKLALSIVVAAVMFGCGENTVSIGNPPTAPEFSIDQTNPNYIVFAVTRAEGFMTNWDFGNGKLSKNKTDTVYYPFADTYTIKLTASNKGGATTTSKKLVVASTDPKICANPYYAMLTGGCEAVSKTWKVYDGDSAYGNGGPSSVDSNSKGTSSYNDLITYWWNSQKVNNIPDPRSLDDEYVFGLRGFTYKNDCHGDFYVNWKWANKLFGQTQGTYADTICSYVPNNPATWTLDVDSTTPEDSVTGKKRFLTDTATGKRFNLLLTLSNGNCLGYYSGSSVYQILRITPDNMYLRHELLDPEKPSVTGSNRLEWRYLHLVAKK